MSGFGITPILQQVYVPLVALIASVTGLPAANIVQGLPNRASMPTPGFISLQATVRQRLRTNVDTWDETGTDPTTASIEEGVHLTVQIDCYGPQSTDEIEGAEDWANILSAVLRDEYGCTALEPTLDPLYADEARMIPLLAGEDQYEERWMLEAHFQFNPVTTIPQQFADVVDLTMVNVEERYPA